MNNLVGGWSGCGSMGGVHVCVWIHILMNAYTLSLGRDVILDLIFTEI